MKRLMIALTVLFVSSILAFAQDQRSVGLGGGMMDGWGWGMASGHGFGWIFIIVLVFLVFLGVVYLIKRK